MKWLHLWLRSLQFNRIFITSFINSGPKGLRSRRTERVTELTGTHSTNRLRVTTTNSLLVSLRRVSVTMSLLIHSYSYVCVNLVPGISDMWEKREGGQKRRKRGVFQCHSWVYLILVLIHTNARTKRTVMRVTCLPLRPFSCVFRDLELHSVTPTLSVQVPRSLLLSFLTSKYLFTAEDSPFS